MIHTQKHGVCKKRHTKPHECIEILRLARPCGNEFGNYNNGFAIVMCIHCGQQYFTGLNGGQGMFFEMELYGNKGLMDRWNELHDNCGVLEAEKANAMKAMQKEELEKRIVELEDELKAEREILSDILDTLYGFYLTRPEMKNYNVCADAFETFSIDWDHFNKIMEKLIEKENKK